MNEPEQNVGTPEQASSLHEVDRSSRGRYEGKLWIDLNSDIERAEFLEEGRGWETGIIAKGIQNQVAEAFRKAASIVGFCDAGGKGSQP